MATNGNRPGEGAAHSVGNPSSATENTRQPTTKQARTELARVWPPTADVLRLYIGDRFTGVTVEPDANYPSMWRIHMGRHESGMVNLTRTKDAATVWARPRGLGGDDIAHWHHRETAAVPSPMSFSGCPATYPYPRRREPKNPSDSGGPARGDPFHERPGVRPSPDSPLGFLRRARP